MSQSSGNPFWKVGKRGHGLARAPRMVVIEERGERPEGDRCLAEFPDREWIGERNQGGGAVPAADNWRRSPKERQDRSMGDSTRRLR